MQDIVRVRLVDTHDHVLSTYDRQIAIYATEQFQRQGIELVMGCRVGSVNAPASKLYACACRPQCQLDGDDVDCVPMVIVRHDCQLSLLLACADNLHIHWLAQSIIYAAE